MTAQPHEQLSAAVVIASAGCPELLRQALATVAAQEGLPFVTVVSVPYRQSLPDGLEGTERVRVVTGARGAAAQHNAGIWALDPETQVVAFFEDDSVLRTDWLLHAVSFLVRHPEVVGLTGRVLLDGAVTGEISQDETAAAIEASWSDPVSGDWRRWEELYGCNFAIRLDLIGGEWFDERLPLYSRLEDHDMARRLLRIGVLAKVEDCVIVHRAAASGGRQSHRRLAYSQVVNPLYLWRRGSFSLSYAVGHLDKRLAKNFVLAVVGPERGRRRQRLRGNLLAIEDASRGRINTQRTVVQ